MKDALFIILNILIVNKEDDNLLKEALTGL